jgi:hypothetical protein
MVVETREAKIGKRSGLHVDIPAQAEIQWVPAFAGMTTRYSAVADVVRQTEIMHFCLRTITNTNVLSMHASAETERAELHKTIWRIANDLRGSVDGWDFKTYVLGMLFYRFISENLTRYINEQQRAAGYAHFDYVAFHDADAELGREATVNEKGLLHPTVAAVCQCAETRAQRR